MEISEFIDTYSDDLIYLHEARRALLTHPPERLLRLPRFLGRILLPSHGSVRGGRYRSDATLSGATRIVTTQASSTGGLSKK